MASQGQQELSLRRFELVRGKCPSAAECAMAMVFRRQGATVEFEVLSPTPEREETLRLVCSVVGLVSLDWVGSTWWVTLNQKGRRADMLERLEGRVDTFRRTGWLGEALEDPKRR